MAILENSFTPLQISVYISTLLNRGTRIGAHILKEVREYGSDERFLRIAIKRMFPGTFPRRAPIDIKLPETVILGIKETEPSIKGQTVTNSFKPAILENGIRVMVPPFVTSEDKIVVKTEDSTYVERAGKK